jgi:hypothetical protein
MLAWAPGCFGSFNAQSSLDWVGRLPPNDLIRFHCGTCLSSRLVHAATPRAVVAEQRQARRELTNVQLPVAIAIKGIKGATQALFPRAHVQEKVAEAVHDKELGVGSGIAVPTRARNSENPGKATALHP